MAKKLYEESNIQAIANAIREKNGETTTYKPSEMAAAITAITTGGGGVEVEPIVLTGVCNYACAGKVASGYIKLFGNTITTRNIAGATSMFDNNTNEHIPFDINFDTNNSHTINNMFYLCAYLKTLPKIYNVKPSNLAGLFRYCYSLREIQEDYFDTWNLSYLASQTSAYSGNASYLFEKCYSLRALPLGWLKSMNPAVDYSYSYYLSGFNACYSLNELVNLPIPYTKPRWFSDAFSGTFKECNRLKNITFEINEDGTPIVVKWKNQTLNLSNYLGYASSSSKNQILGWNSGITADKEVIDDATYQALKNDPDWFTCDVNYSRYNHDSAVATINSLPDASAYLATQSSGTNTIKFKGEAGSLTDGGAINTLTEEEIAVAAAKGWTVSFV